MTEPATARFFVGRADSGPAFWLGGDRYSFIAVGRQTAGAFAVYETFIPPGHGARPHVHSHESESFYVLSGRLAISVDSQATALEAGDFIHFPPGILYGFRNEGEEPVRLLTILIPAGLEEFVANAGVAAGSTATGPECTSADIERMIADARKYGVEYPRPRDAT